MEKAFNFGNIMKPGAHPKHKKAEDKKEEKKSEKKMSKADELRDRLKPVKIE